jgi:hypothetical protein
MVIADASGVLEMHLDAAVGLLLYDRSRRRAAACRVETCDWDPARPFREQVDVHAMALLSRLLAGGSRPEAIEVFVFGADASTGPPPPPPGGPAGSRVGACGRPTMVYGRAPGLGPRRMEFEVATGRMLLEDVADGGRESPRPPIEAEGPR